MAVTECYIKGRYDFGVGKCAVVIVEGGKVIHQVAWKVPDSWDYKGETIKADQYNCEILAATFALQWCALRLKPLVNIYSNLNTCQKWYLRRDFPESRNASAKMYTDASDGYKASLDEHEGNEVAERVYAEWIPKDCDEAKYAEFNYLLNQIAENVK